MTQRFPSLLLSGLSIVAVACSAFFGSALAADPVCDAPPLRAIVGGHNVQPRADRLSNLGRSDLTASQAQEVDQLFEDLMGRSAVTRSGAS